MNNKNENIGYKVRIPLSDGEKFYRMFTGKTLEPEFVTLNRNEYKSLKDKVQISLVIGLVGLLLTGFAEYNQIIQKHDSLTNAYKSFMEQVDKYPSRMWNTF